MMNVYVPHAGPRIVLNLFAANQVIGFITCLSVVNKVSSSEQRLLIHDRETPGAPA